MRELNYDYDIQDERDDYYDSLGDQMACWEAERDDNPEPGDYE
jgi:hypothetical protein